MHLKTGIRILFALLFLSACRSEDHTNHENADNKMFHLLTPAETSVNFQNILTEGSNANVLLYEYFYNGGGVAAADFNGDGLDDLYFTANMTANKMYLNNGNLKFQDITELSGAAGRSIPWKTGVSVVDINSDGRVDIYLCYSGILPPEKRINQLFVNQGNDANGVPHFLEKADEYGLASTGYSNQAYFFDADLDNDIDMLLLNHNPRNLPILNEEATQQLLNVDDPETGLRFFKQHKGYFTDETIKVGVNGSSLSYGLGLAIADFNDDGWPDFYVSNDYMVPDYLYINKRDGTFENRLPHSMGHSSEFSMGNDAADINNDGLVDIFTLDMLPQDNKRQKLLTSPDNFNKFDLHLRSGFYYQYMRNMLHLNNGDATFSEVGQQFGISNTDWSWSALLADYNNDGWKDLMITNGYLRDYTNQDFIKHMDNYLITKGHLAKADVLEVIKNMPASDVVNYIFQNKMGTEFIDKTQAWGMGEVANSNGATYSDLDSDGDLDFVVNNINKPAFIFRNDVGGNYLTVNLRGPSGNTQGIGAVVQIEYEKKKQRLEQNPLRGYLSAVTQKLHFGLGKQKNIDSLSIVWPDGKTQYLTGITVNQILTLDYKDATLLRPRPKLDIPRFSAAGFIVRTSPIRATRDYDRQPLLIHELSFDGPCMAKADVNNDGLEDLFVGSEPGVAAKLFLQNKQQQLVENKKTEFDKDAKAMDTDALFQDFNRDGFLDLYVCSGGYHDFVKGEPTLQDRIYFNDGRGNFIKKDILPKMFTATATVAAADINTDGLMDLFVGGRCVPGRYPEAPQSYILIQEKLGRFVDKTREMASELRYFGMVTAAQWADLDADHQPELIIVGEWLPISIFKIKNQKLENVTSTFVKREYKGWWNTLVIKDLNADGKPDILAGNMGLNTQFRASEKEPLELFFSDFDKNGSLDPIFSFYIQGQRYPYLTREELIGQLPKFRTQFTTFESYANTTFDQLISSDEQSRAGHLEANFMETALFLSQKGGSYALTCLPKEAQYSSVHAMLIEDFNVDGMQDIFIAGNTSRTQLRFGKFDANYGQLLLGNGKGNFTYLPQPKSGFSLHGDVRSAIWLKNKLLVGVNGEGVRSYRVSTHKNNGLRIASNHY